MTDQDHEPGQNDTPTAAPSEFDAEDASPTPTQPEGDTAPHVDEATTHEPAGASEPRPKPDTSLSVTRKARPVPVSERADRSNVVPLASLAVAVIVGAATIFGVWLTNRTNTTTEALIAPVFAVETEIRPEGLHLFVENSGDPRTVIPS